MTTLINSNSDKRYTVEKGFYPCKEGDRECYFVLDNGLPALAINKDLIQKQLGHARPSSTAAYVICDFLNSMNKNGIGISDVTMNHIYLYLKEKYDSNLAYSTVSGYIVALSNLFENLAIENYPLDRSLFYAYPGTQVRVKRDRQSVKLTKVSSLRKRFIPKMTEKKSQYTKWYTDEQATAIANELSIGYRGIFWDTISNGHRVDSALSITLDTMNLREGFVRPTRTKTDQKHTSPMIEPLRNAIETYITEERSAIVARTGSTSPYVFLNRRGEPIRYHAYNMALKRAGDRVKEKFPGIGLTEVHTHAGRSTFAKALRDYQLEQRRNNQPALTDEDFCTFMDWKSMKPLVYYDIATRAQEAAPLLEGFYTQLARMLQLNKNEG